MRPGNRGCKTSKKDWKSSFDSGTVRWTQIFVSFFQYLFPSDKHSFFLKNLQREKKFKLVEADACKKHPGRTCHCEKIREYSNLTMVKITEEFNTTVL